MTPRIKISDTEMRSVQEAAVANARTFSAQIEHWIRLGRAAESRASKGDTLVAQALLAQRPISSLNAAQQEQYLNRLSKETLTPTPQEDAFWAARDAAGLGVGIDEHGALARPGMESASNQYVEAKALAISLGGTRAALRTPDLAGTKTFRGQLAGETDLHWVQQVDYASYIAHLKSALPNRLRLHGVYEIHYTQPGRGIVHELGRIDAIKTARATPISAGARPPRAHAFASDSRVIALAQYPELAGAYAALDAVEAQVLRDYPANPRAQSLVMRASKVATQRRLDAGHVPVMPELAKMHEAKVASKNRLHRS